MEVSEWASGGTGFYCTTITHVVVNGDSDKDVT